MPDFRRIGTQRDILGECPLWDDDRGALFWIDIRSPAIRCYDPRDGGIESWAMPDLVGSIALSEDGRLLVALADEVSVFDIAAGTFDTIARLPHRGAAGPGSWCHAGPDSARRVPDLGLRLTYRAKGRAELNGSN